MNSVGKINKQEFADRIRCMLKFKMDNLLLVASPTIVKDCLKSGGGRVIYLFIISFLGGWFN